ncbi:MAG TPA: hypothetical protein VGS20_13945 [Candidatus Acidoferrales bacterium]|nr:hypothetical protein [Candidatus Acidoferrales bacterium]
MVVLDSTFLTFLFVPNAKCGVDRPRDRVDFLISDLRGRGERVRVPAPALSELLVRTGHSTQQILHELTQSPRFQVEPFDTRAAIEVALMSIDASKSGAKRAESKDTYAKVKYDRQIVAIAKVLNATIYSEDEEVRKLAQSRGLTAKSIADCPLPYASREEGPGPLFGGLSKDNSNAKENEKK